MFLSVDVDVVDPGMAPGTGTPEPGGLTSRQLLDAVRRVCLELPVVGVDVVEVSPPYDHAEVTAFLANRDRAGGTVGDRPPTLRRALGPETPPPGRSLGDRGPKGRGCCALLSS